MALLPSLVTEDRCECGGIGEGERECIWGERHMTFGGLRCEVEPVEQEAAVRVLEEDNEDQPHVTGGF